MAFYAKFQIMDKADTTQSYYFIGMENRNINSSIECKEDIVFVEMTQLFKNAIVEFCSYADIPSEDILYEKLNELNNEDITYNYYNLMNNLVESRVSRIIKNFTNKEFKYADGHNSQVFAKEIDVIIRNATKKWMENITLPDIYF